jgi:chitodextrinase
VSAARHSATLLAAVLAAIVGLTAVDYADAGKRGKRRDREAPSAPANVRVEAASQSSINLSWDRSTDDVRVSRYLVYVNGDRDRVAGPAYTADRLGCGETVAFWIVAVDWRGKRSARVAATASTAACLDVKAPTPPSGFRQAVTTEDTVVLSWSSATDDVGVVGYGIYENGLRVSTTTQPTATLNRLGCDTTYQYALDAVDAAGNRSSRAPVFVRTAPCPDRTAPSAPTGLEITTRTPSSLTVSWAGSSDNVGVSRYSVSVNGGSGTSVSGTAMTLSGLACATSYTVGVSALDAAGNSSPAASLAASTAACPAPTPTAPTPPPPAPTPPPPAPTPPPTAPLPAPTPPPAGDTTPPAPPTGLAVSAATPTSITFGWAAATDNVGVTGYEVFRNGTSLQTMSQRTATVSGLACGTAYTLGVEARDAAGNRSTRAAVLASTGACADTQAPTAPSGPVSTSRSQNSIALAWTGSTDNVGVVGYGLYRGGTRVGTSVGTTGVFSGLACNTNYSLAVDAYDAAGNRSATSGVLLVSTTACPDTAPPSAPTGLSASAVSQNGLTLSWNASSDNVGVSGYDVYRGGTKVASVTSTSGVQTGLACGTSYAFGVIARDAAGNSSPQTSLGASTSACSVPPPPAPTPPPPAPTPPPPAPTPPSSANVFLAPSGSDGSPCTKASPCRSLKRGLAVAQPGQVVELAGGSYSGEILSGDRGGLVTFRPASGATATFTSFITLTSLRNVRLENFVFATNDPYRDLSVDACNRDVQIVNFTGLRFSVLEGNENITFQGGSWGGYSQPGTGDSGIGTAGAYGPTRTCNGAAPGPARNIVFDGLTFHDVFWGKAPSEWGGSHPDCFEINGNATGVTIRNSTFLRCGDSFIGLYTDQGDLTNITLENNTFRDLGNYTWFSIQLHGGPSRDSGKRCGGIVFRGNRFEPNNPGALGPYSSLRTTCDTTGSGLPGTLVEGNSFQAGPGSSSCLQWKAAPWNSTWRNNTFSNGGNCVT